MKQTHTYKVSQKVNPKALNNILAYAKPFCSVISNFYPHMFTKFWKFTLKFNAFGSIFHEHPHFLQFLILSIAVGFGTFAE